MRTNLKYLSDEELFRLVQLENNSLAYTILYERFKKPLLTYTIKKVGSESAVDIVHDVLGKIWSHRTKIFFEQKFSWYIFHLLRNKIIDNISKNKNSNKYLNSLTAEEVDCTIGDTDLKIRQELFWKEIDEHLLEFGTNAKTIIKLNMDGYSNHEIAKELNLSEKTIRNQKSKIIKFLKSKFSFLFLIGLILTEIFTRK